LRSLVIFGARPTDNHHKFMTKKSESNQTENDLRSAGGFAANARRGQRKSVLIINPIAGSADV
jgi:hypothetical protein